MVFTPPPLTGLVTRVRREGNPRFPPREAGREARTFPLENDSPGTDGIVQQASKAKQIK